MKMHKNDELLEKKDRIMCRLAREIKDTSVSPTIQFQILQLVSAAFDLGALRYSEVYDSVEDEDITHGC